MVDLIIGVPGSGKTYFAVDRLYKLITSDSKKYKHIYTNINGLDYQKCNELANIPDYVKPFEFEDLNTHIMDEYKFHTSQKEKKSKSKIIPLKTDTPQTIIENESDKDELIIDYDEKCKELGIYAPFLDSLIIIDECHLYFEDKTDEPKIRFLSYHRHFNIDIILITQGKNLIHKKYLSFVETMYKGLSGAKRFLSTRFRYKKYASYQEYNQNLIETTSLSLNAKVFQLYNSGNSNITKSALKQMLFPVFILMVFSFIFYKVFIADRFNKPATTSNVTQQEQNLSVTSQQQNSPQKIIYEHEPDINEKPFFAVTCFRKSCNFKDIDYSFDESTMYKFINAFNCKVVVPDNSNSAFSVYVLRCDKDLNFVLSLYKPTPKTSSKAVKNEDSHSLSLLNH